MRLILTMCFIMITATPTAFAQSPTDFIFQNSWGIEYEPTEAYDVPTEEDVQAAQEEIERLFPQQPLQSRAVVNEASVLAKYPKVYPNAYVPNDLLKDALLFFDANSGFSNRDYITIVDFSRPSWEKRFFVIDMQTGGVHRRHVAHGSGSDTNNDGYLESFSNNYGSHASSKGFFRVSEDYYGTYGYSARLDGLSSTNSNARGRAVVLHGSDYVVDQDLKQGRSWGCFTISWTYKDELVELVRDGSLLYSGVSQEN